MDAMMGREGAKEMRNLFAGGSETERRSPCLLWTGDPNSPPCFQAARWCRDRTDLNSCGLPADTGLLHPPICPRNLVTKISLLLFCSCFNSVVEPPPVSCVHDPALVLCAQVFVWCPHCQGTSCHHVNGWCSSLGTAVPSLSSLFDPPAQFSAARLLSLADCSDLWFLIFGLSYNSSLADIMTDAEQPSKVFMSH